MANDKHKFPTQCNVLLPAVATLLHANAQEFSAMRDALQAQGAWWPQNA